MLTQNVIRIAAKCNTNAKCNNIDAKCNKIFNAECNNLSTLIVITFLTHNVVTQNIKISEQRRACYQISNPNQITHKPFPSSGQKWSALKDEIEHFLWIARFKIWCDCVAEQIQGFV